MNGDYRFDLFQECFSLRLQALRHVLNECTSRARDDAANISRLASEFGSFYPGRELASFSKSLEIWALLVQWASAARQAESDADRYLRAARLICTEFLNSETTEPKTAFSALLTRVQTIEIPTEVQGFRDELLKIPLGIGFSVQTNIFKIRSLAAGNKKGEEPVKIIFVNFLIDGKTASSFDSLRPGTAYDIELDVRVSRWPSEAEALILEPISVEPRDFYSLPTFNFIRPEGDGPFAFRDSGRLRLNVPLSIGARPYEFRYAASFTPKETGDYLDVVGHRSLKIEGVDPAATPLSGFAGIDRRLISLRAELRSAVSVPDEDIKNALTVCGQLGNLAGQALAEALFDAGTDESTFQKRAIEWLRRSPLIGEKLEQHPHIGGGITDLSFERIRIELKCQNNAILGDDDVRRYCQQTAQYTISTGKRIGVLCILDANKKSEISSPAEEMIHLSIRNVGLSNIPIIVIVIQGGLPLPSALSR